VITITVIGIEGRDIDGTLPRRYGGPTPSPRPAGAAQGGVVGTITRYVKSLSGHIPRSSLRSSDLLPFYHQYPAACCGDFLFIVHMPQRALPFRGAARLLRDGL
jgi:hypothetical protein